MHPVDKVHVGPSGRSEHDLIAGRLTEPGVGGPVIPADVGLDLNDPPDAPPGWVIADQACPEQGTGSRQGGSGEGFAREDDRLAQRSG